MIQQYLQNCWAINKLHDVLGLFQVDKKTIASSFKKLRTVNVPAAFEIKMSLIINSRCFSVCNFLCVAVVLIYCCQPTLAVLTEDDAVSSLVSGLRANQFILVSSLSRSSNWMHGICTVIPFLCSYHINAKLILAK